MNRIFILIGLQRCGTHAIVNWILRQRKGEVGKRYVVSGHNFIHPTVDGDIYYFNLHKFNKPLIQRDRKIILEATIGNDCMICFEEGHLFEYNEKLLFKGIDVSNYNITRIISLRDAWNFFASYIKKFKRVHSNYQQYWIERAREIIGETNYLKNSFNFINYNL